MMIFVCDTLFFRILEKIEKNLNFFQKKLDKSKLLWYN